MAEKTTREVCIEELRKAEKPLTSREVADLTQRAASGVSAILGMLYVDGTVDRENVGPATSPLYAYTFNDPPKPPRPIESVRRKPTKKTSKSVTVRSAPEPLAPTPETITPPAQIAPEPVVLPELNSLLDTLASRIADQLITRILTNVTARLPNAFPEAAQTIVQVPTAAAPKSDRPKLSIVGLLPDQQNMIFDEFSDKFKLSFVERTNSKQLKQAAVNSSRVIVMTNFIPHTTENTLKASGANILRVAGGMSELRRNLDVLRSA